ncbi:hypothetical protein [Rheinheimera texasensis]|uniref:hypothetical protein n=1 Tax=Rheinheimera texasensis TaxID=306205 RepID=UPI0032B1F727
MKKYMCNPLGDMSVLYDNVFGANFTRAVITSEKPKEREWIQPIFANSNEALLFQDMLISKLSIDDSSVEKMELELMSSDMYYSISLAILNRMQSDVSSFLKNPKVPTPLQGKDCTLFICGLGSAGIPVLYNSFNQSMTATQIVAYLNSLTIEDPATLKLYVTSNGSAAKSHYTFESIDDMHLAFSANMVQNGYLSAVVGTEGSLAAELCKALSKKEPDAKYDFSTTEVYGYLFPVLAEGIKSYSVEPEDKCMTDYKTLSMTAIVSVYTKDQQYYQQIPVRRSLTKVKLTAV